MELSQQAWYFIVLAIGAIATAVGTITRRNPVSAAMNLVAHFFMLSGLYLTLQAQFVAVVQILVYAGAIMVLVVSSCF
jgi:NADH-quinone oxidoreductase subunit J